MNKSSADSVDLVKSILLEIGDQKDVGVVVCPPFTALESAAGVLSEVNHIQLGAQTMSHQAEGAYTGEISAAMLRHLYVSYVILGHSERREYQNESDALINKKVLAALESNLKPILCVGETLEERESDKTFDVIEKQIRGGLNAVAKDKADQIVIAYEPVWAIGTGKTATPEMAQAVHAKIRQLLASLLDEATANRVRILYGGSMKPANADALLAQPDIDGGLIGGAALDAMSFAKLVASAQKAGN